LPLLATGLLVDLLWRRIRASNGRWATKFRERVSNVWVELWRVAETGFGAWWEPPEHAGATPAFYRKGRRPIRHRERKAEKAYQERNAHVAPQRRGARRRKKWLRVALLAALALQAMAVGAATAVVQTELVAVGATALAQARALAVAAQLTAPPSPRQRLTHPEIGHLETNAFFPERRAPLTSEAHVKDEEHGWVYGNHRDFSEGQRAELKELLLRNKGAFAYSMKDLPGYCGSVGDFKIELTHNKPIIQRPRRMPQPQRVEMVRSKTKELVESGIAEPVTGPTNYAYNPVLAPKKNPETGEMTDFRFAIDFRPINAATKVDPYCMPHPEEIHQRMMNKARIFSKIDCRAGFMQIPVALGDRDKLTFWCGTELYRFKRMPFGVVGATAFFQRVMDSAIREAGLTHCCVAFVDDILVWSDTPEEHLQHLQKLFRCLEENGLRAHPDKSVFACEQLEYLGHNISAYGMSPNEAKIRAFMEMKPPRNVAELRSLLGGLGYYRGYVPNYSRLMQPLTRMLAKDSKEEWGPAQDAALAAVKAVFATPGLVLKRIDYTRTLIVHTDWSKNGIGAVLSQIGEDGKEVLCATASRSLNKHERNYSAYKGEMLAAVWALLTFKPHLLGMKVELHTDHQPLQSLLARQDLEGQEARWCMALQDFDLIIKHRPGVTNQNADMLSRNPRETTEDWTEARMDHEVGAAAAAHLLAEGALERAALAAVVGRVAKARCAQELRERLRRPVAEGIDDFAPHGQSDRWQRDQGDDEAELGPVASNSRYLRQHIADMARRHKVAVRGAIRGAYQGLRVSGEPDRWGVRQVEAASTQLVGGPFPAGNDGLVLLEAFGGLGAGLEAALRVGWRIKRYIYVDIDPEARAVMQHRLGLLRSRHPGQLTEQACAGAFTALPQDVTRITSRHLLEAGAGQGEQWLVVAGSECQDLSPAGAGRGLEGPRSRTFYDAVAIIGTLQQLQKERPPAYIVENVAMQFNRRSEKIRTEDYAKVVARIGHPITLDAAQFGSYAHRTRNFWTNLADAGAVMKLAAFVQRMPRRLVDDVLDAHHASREPTKPDDPTWQHCVNVVGQPRVALPTLVAYPHSYCFRDGKSGTLQATTPNASLLESGDSEEPSAEERERILGYYTGDTAAPGLSDAARHRITGRCMDAHCMEGLFLMLSAVRLYPPAAPPHVPVGEASAAVAERIMASQGWRPGRGLGARHQGPVTFVAPAAQQGTTGLGFRGSSKAARRWRTFIAAGAALSEWEQGGEEGAHAESGGEEERVGGVAAFLANAGGNPSSEAVSELLNAAHATAQEHQQGSGGSADVWLDAHTLHYVRHQEHAPHLSQAEQRRVRKRAALYAFKGDKLYRRYATGRQVQVPQPEERANLVTRTHRDTGHWGVRRCAKLLAARFWWSTMFQDVERHVRHCEECDRQQAEFTYRHGSLQPLEIKGLFYRWQVDLCGPFTPTKRNNKYIMVCVESFTKFVVLVALQGKQADYTAHAFSTRVLGVFGGCAEVVTDKGTEFQGEFQDLLVHHLIDHRTTSANHPQANGLAERTVRSVKAALQCMLAGSAGKEWDELTPCIALGYNCSTQASTRSVPYYLVFAQQPVVPPAIKERMEEPLDVDIAAPELARALLDRAQAVKRHLIIAGENLAVAQHQQSERYATMPGGGYRPKQRKFEVGDYVYHLNTEKMKKGELQLRPRPSILRVVRVKPSGVLRLQGRCGAQVDRHAQHCAPCHLPMMDEPVDPRLQRAPLSLKCEACLKVTDPGVLLLCDKCGRGWHLFCLEPPLEAVPEGTWLCQECSQAGVTVEQVESIPLREAPARLVTRRGRAAPSAPEAVASNPPAEVRPYLGRMLSKVFLEKKGAQRRKGPVAWLGMVGGQPHVEVAYEHGVKETMSVRELKEGLDARALRWGPGRPPKMVAVSALEIKPPRAPPLPAMPADWDLTTGEGVLKAMEFLLPGQHGRRHATRLSNLAPGGLHHLQGAGQQRPGQPQCVATEEAEVVALLRAVDLERVDGVLDPWCGTGTIARVLRRKGLEVATNDINVFHEAHFHLDALRPEFWRAVVKAAVPHGAIVMSPLFGVLDLALPLAVLFMDRVVCCHVPGHYVTDATPARLAWLRRLKAAGRLLLVLGLPRGPMGRRCMWIVVFRDRQERRRLALAAGQQELLL
jgi:site-specific DNA-cytosine methylase